MTKSTKLLSVKVPLPRDGRIDVWPANEWRREHAGNDNYASPKGLLVTISDIVRQDPKQRYPYHKIFAYDEINKAAKR